MRWRGRIGENTREVILEKKGDSGLCATVDGRSYSLSVSEPQTMVYSMLVDGASHEAIVQVRKGAYRVRIGSAVFEVSPDAPGGFNRGRRGDGQAVIAAVMPGRVLRILVKPGEAVEAHQGLVVLEAMKMENEIQAPRAGTVGEIKVETGQIVEMNDPLVILA